MAKGNSWRERERRGGPGQGQREGKEAGALGLSVLYAVFAKFSSMHQPTW